MEETPHLVLSQDYKTLHPPGPFRRAQQQWRHAGGRSLISTESGQQKGKQSKGGVRPKGKGPTGKATTKPLLRGTCFRCGRWEHTAAKCPSGKPGSCSAALQRRTIDLEVQRSMSTTSGWPGPDSQFHEMKTKYAKSEFLVHSGWLIREPDTAQNV